MIGRWRSVAVVLRPVGNGNRHGDRLRQRVGNVLEPEDSEPDGALQAERSRRLTAFGTRIKTRRDGGGEAQPAAWAAEAGHGITARSFLAGHARRLGRVGSSPGRLRAHHRARSKRGGARGRTRAARARTRSRCRSVLNPAWLAARGVRSARSTSRWSSGHRLAAGAAALIHPALGVQAISRRCGIAVSGEIHWQCFAGVVFERR